MAAMGNPEIRAMWGNRSLSGLVGASGGDGKAWNARLVEATRG